MRIHNRPELKARRRVLRSALTPAEAVLWKNLQRAQLEGKKFRRQHSVGNYVLDFYCPECRLAIELDGQGHFNSFGSVRDFAREEFLKGYNIRVLRFENMQVFRNQQGVLEAIKQELSRNSPPRMRRGQGVVEMTTPPR